MAGNRYINNANNLFSVPIHLHPPALLTTPPLLSWVISFTIFPHFRFFSPSPWKNAKLKKKFARFNQGDKINEKMVSWWMNRLFLNRSRFFFFKGSIIISKVRFRLCSCQRVQINSCYCHVIGRIRSLEIVQTFDFVKIS